MKTQNKILHTKYGDFIGLRCPICGNIMKIKDLGQVTIDMGDDGTLYSCATCNATLHTPYTRVNKNTIK